MDAYTLAALVAILGVLLIIFIVSLVFVRRETLLNKRLELIFNQGKYKMIKNSLANAGIHPKNLDLEIERLEKMENACAEELSRKDPIDISLSIKK